MGEVTKFGFNPSTFIENGESDFKYRLKKKYTL